MTAEINIRHRLGQYPVLIGEGLLEKTGSLVRTRLASAKAAIVTDKNVAPHYLSQVRTSLENEGFQAKGFILAAGEATKTFETLEKLVADFLDFGLERGDCVISLGGGVVGDLAGLAANLTRRGVNLVMMPTTLLSQVDSSVGGKTAVNMAQGKNLAGTFYPATLVISDATTLSSLPPRELRNGYAEVVKHAILESSDDFAFLENNLDENLKGNPHTLMATIHRSIQVKARIVEEDETEQGRRMLLNLGHTFGHALEAYAGFSDKLLHGEAVAIGMCLAFRFAGADEKDFARIKAHLDMAGLPTDVGVKNLEPDLDKIMSFIHQDKKSQGGKIRLVLPKALGDVYIEDDVSETELKEFLKAEWA